MLLISVKYDTRCRCEAPGDPGGPKRCTVNQIPCIFHQGPCSLTAGRCVHTPHSTSHGPSTSRPALRDLTSAGAIPTRCQAAGPWVEARIDPSLVMARVRQKNGESCGSKNYYPPRSDHFQCPTLAGAELESDGSSGTAGSHWEQRVLAPPPVLDTPEGRYGGHST